MSEPKRWMIEWDDAKGCSCAQKEHPEGDFVYYSAYAEVKAGWRKAALKSISDIGQLGEQSAEIAYLKSEVKRLKNNVEYLDRSLDNEIDRSADHSRLHAAVFAKVADAKAELDKCGTLETPGIKAWRILNELLTPPPLP